MTTPTTPITPVPSPVPDPTVDFTPIESVLIQNLRDHRTRERRTARYYLAAAIQQEIQWRRNSDSPRLQIGPLPYFR